MMMLKMMIINVITITILLIIIIIIIIATIRICVAYCDLEFLGLTPETPRQSYIFSIGKNMMMMMMMIVTRIRWWDGDDGGDGMILKIIAIQRIRQSRCLSCTPPIIWCLANTTQSKLVHCTNFDRLVVQCIFLHCNLGRDITWLVAVTMVRL